MDDEGQNDVSVASSSSVDCNSPDLKERNYLGLSDYSSAESSRISVLSEDSKSNLNLKATELRLGLPGSQSPERYCSGKLDEKQLFPLSPLSQKGIVSGNKRVFSEVNKSTTKDVNWIFNASENQVSGSGDLKNIHQSLGHAGAQSNMGNATLMKASNEHSHVMNQKSVADAVPAAKAQVVGWPPVRSFRKNSLASTLRNNEEVNGKPGPGALFIKVSLDGAPYLRKVDLRNYVCYQELSSALEKMFSCFIVGQCGYNGTVKKERQTENSSQELLHGSEYVLTYEDKDGDWMLVGDVPWEMFMNTCKKLKIMKGSDAIGLVFESAAPRAAGKSIK
ncbi:hypothetical protein SAY87_032146 [Trapa incisa]|uniref:Auxin-responsive protein n=2 Tax=Trapa TaxID=22665 RepID=A0AAN7MGD2_TRANT|nr:hypothetical protein SAY87_032146 [Trapa incisa]KAK4796705.1 hypothetical protein SAY86_029031 [Trapa natans]